MKNIIYPYPFKLSTTGDLSDGIVFQIPSFCKSNHKTKKCRDFYTKECEIEGYKQLPIWFCSEYKSISRAKSYFFVPIY